MYIDLQRGDLVLGQSEMITKGNSAVLTLGFRIHDKTIPTYIIQVQ